MTRQKVLWSSILAAAVLFLAMYLFLIANQGLPSGYGPGFYGGGMMGLAGGYYQGPVNENAVKLSDEEQIKAAEAVIARYGDPLEVSDVFFYADSDTYVSVEEKDTGRGAMELLVNPYTGTVYPEPGPNMMWNEKYGMMGRGMMGNSFWRNSGSASYVTPEQAMSIADRYLKKAFGASYQVMDQGHSFYGYYTFHFNKNEKPDGMLSVNAYTGDVWFHNWHGRLERVIEND